MRYTRYNYKKTKKNSGLAKTILSFLAMSVFVVIVGIMLANIIIHFLPLNDAGKSQANPESVNQSENTDNSEAEVVADNSEDVQASGEVDNSTQGQESAQGSINTSFMAIQCGYFANEDNAKEAYNKIANGYGAFIYNESDKFKVIAGVYTSQEGQSIIDTLTSNGIDSTKVSFDLNLSDKVQSQVAGIYNGYLNILDTVFKDDVKSFDTTDFKNWVKELEVLNEGDKNDVLTELKNHVNDMATEIKKEDVANEMQYLYKILLSFS